MTIASYTLPRFIEDLRRVASETTDPRDIIGRVRPLARDLALARVSWLRQEHYETDTAQGFGFQLLHEEADHTLPVVVVAWPPGGGALPHNHGTWGVVAGVDGPETNVFWRRLDDGSRPGYAEIEPEGTKIFAEGDVVSLLPETIHSVRNETDRVTVSLHVYGKHINYTGRSQFDPATNTESLWILKDA
jgi:predicted metal-dependent enzyme (double-stranded beta helix superfamily)